ncbi:gll2955 [Gloeobacter violaceus PCC 7421]|uniref:Gll2955 protein n=1 Tax=Gloeobacter violaceus (strain ATCC 29082 / PCC 7421) TaxID=251221 RepID=Q7NCM3_GLOVI|nr:gll2955 [Gloeobacter violaceus PCC 7421]
MARELRRRGVDVLTVVEDGRGGTSDSAVLDRAIQLGRVLFTQDDDLLVEAQRRQEAATSFPGIIYAHPMRASIAECVNDLEIVAKAMEPLEMADRVWFLPL